MAVLTADEVERYEREGFPVLPALGDAAWLARLRAVTGEILEASRAVAVGQRDWRFDLEPDHTPDVKFHHSKLNVEEPHGGEEVRWHQEIQSWPHTNDSPLTAAPNCSARHDPRPCQVGPGACRSIFQVQQRER